jgi:hypothetical protein
MHQALLDDAEVDKAEPSAERPSGSVVNDSSGC